LRFEPLEGRRLLSVVPPLPANPQPHPAFAVDRLIAYDYSGSSNPFGLTPNQVRGAYGLGAYGSSGGITFYGIQGDGSGQTIAIIDQYDDPNALTDLNAFSAYYNLPQFNTSGGPTFQKLDANGGTNLPGTDPAGPSSSTGNNTWEMEESLDIEWAHVVAPEANIDLFEAQSASGLFTAASTAASTPGVTVVSMSWSVDESSYSARSEERSDSNYFSKQGVTFLAAAGDDGAYAADNATTITPQYPACSPYVVAVGGTSLTVSGSDPNYTYGSETSWGNGALSGTPGDGGGGGGGVSLNEPQPSYQTGVVSAFSTSNRTYPDVSADANPNTGVPIYDSWDFGTSTPWLTGTMGGTSLACPLWAGMVAIADQGRSLAGLSPLDGASQTLPTLYSLPAADFHDVTSGNSIGVAPGGTPSYSPGAGYDLATGLGSPVGNLLIPQLAALGIAAQPTVATPAAASANPVTGNTVGLSVLGADLTGEADLTYTWSTATLPSGASAPTFSANQSNAAKNTTATFSSAGTYVFLVTITAAGGLSTTSSVSATVSQTLTSFSITVPPSGGSGADGAGSFAATALDQFGIPLANQPPLPWSLSEDGIDFNSPAGATVGLDGESPTFATVTFSGAGYTIAQQGSGGTLLLANGADSATLTVAAGEDTISAPVALQSNLVVLPAAGSQLTISGGISGAGQSLSIDGQGTVILSGADSYTGGTTVSAGTLTVTSPSAIAASTRLTVGAGGTFVFDPSVAAPSSAVVAATPAIANSTDTTKASANATAVSTASVPTSTSSSPAAVAASEVPLGQSLAFVAMPARVLPLAVPPAAANSRLRQTVSQRISDAPATVPIVPAPVAKGPIRAILPQLGKDRRSESPSPAAAVLAWTGQTADGTDNSSARHKSDISIRALDAVFAQYGR